MTHIGISQDFPTASLGIEIVVCSKPPPSARKSREYLSARVDILQFSGNFHRDLLVYHFCSHQNHRGCCRLGSNLIIAIATVVEMCRPFRQAVAVRA